MFRRIVTEHWQASLALALFILASLGCLMQLLSVLHMKRDHAERGASMALGDDEIRPPTTTNKTETNAG
jgi:heme/copper-type cytochrome/quinol oxidase subunit 4